MIEDDTMHPNGEVTTEGRQPVEQHAVRRWISAFTGDVLVRGHVAKVYEDGTTNGVVVRVRFNGVDGWSYTIPGWDDEGVDFEVASWIDEGAAIDLVVEPNESDDWSDRTVFTVAIEAA